MTFLDHLERRLGRFAIPGLIRYIVALNALVFLLGVAEPAYLEKLAPNGEAIRQGEVWRLVSWIFIPNTQSLIFIFFYLSFTWWVGNTLEEIWGSFRFNLYYLLGIIGGSVAAVVFGASGGNIFLVLSLLLAIASLVPNQEIMFWFWPLKLKWVAVIGLIFPVLLLVTGSLADKAAVVLGLVNYLIFFGPYFLRQAKDKKTVQARRAKFEAAKLPETSTLHKCSVCGITEVSNPRADFRVADDDQEYCTDHLPR